ncbi:hypothetical protein ACJ73_01754 [Blastomyces percursus]|uniref:Uncharacterized protein n=1 Tax=Blastomyces percursus TaxID=1658174 RepID=A0A1J9RFU3_9EURO|nr:hypothetical protein ACJ73_01754 [Blastomyces percursus]
MTAGKTVMGEAGNDDNGDSGGSGSGIPDDLSLKRPYPYLDEETTPTHAIDADFMSLGNRRPISRPCQLRYISNKKLKQKAADGVEGAKE